MKSVDVEMWIHDDSEDKYHLDVDLIQNINTDVEVPIAKQIYMFINFLRAQTYTDNVINQFINIEAVENGDWY